MFSNSIQNPNGYNEENTSQRLRAKLYTTTSISYILCIPNYIHMFVCKSMCIFESTRVKPIEYCVNIYSTVEKYILFVRSNLIDHVLRLFDFSLLFD